MPGGGPCPDTVCGLDDRESSRVLTVCERSEDMWDAVRRYEYDEDHRWSGVLGRVLAGWLRAIVKSAPTGRFLGLGVAERRAIAEGPLREALSVPEPGRVAGRRVLVFDDVYSEGYSLREMARALRRAGAAEVAGLVLTRRKGC